MRFILPLSFLFCLLPNLCSSQELITVGTEWFYSSFFFFNQEDYSNLYIANDTVIEDKQCLVLINGQPSCRDGDVVEYLHVDQDQVYLYDPVDSNFKLLYDFSLSTNDTMVYELGQMTYPFYYEGSRKFVMRVDSVGVFSANGLDLKSFFFSYKELGTPDSYYIPKHLPVIEGVGSLENFFWFSEISGFCDDWQIWGLRCFNTFDWGLFEFDTVACTYTSIEEYTVFNKLAVYPNPFHDKVQLSIVRKDKTLPVTLDIIGIMGNHLFSTDLGIEVEYDLDLLDLPVGIYLLRFRDGRTHNILATRKIVKYR